MSTIMIYNGNVMSFSEFCLSEGITPVRTKHGVDMQNGQIGTLHLQNNTAVHYSLFKHNEGHHCVLVLPSGEVGLGTSDKPSLDPFDYSHERKHNRVDAIGAFGKSMYVLNHITQQKNIKKIHFSGSDQKLSVLYGHMVKNKPFKDTMKQYGWKYQGCTEDGHHHFVRK